MNFKLKRSFLLLLLWLPGLVRAQGHAGPDKTICVSGMAKLGSAIPCTTCCYKWEPATGLDDPSKPNPEVSGLTTSIDYAVTVSFPDGNYETDDVKVTVYDANISIYEPEYFAIGTMIPDNEKKIPGAQTFVNLDNDDCDTEFDKDDDVVLGGDNEFVKIKVTMHIALPPAKPGKGAQKGTAMLGPEDKYAAIDLAEGTSVSGIHLWLSNDKTAGEYQIGDQLLLSPVDDDDYEVYLWAEGKEAHIVQQQVKLTARLFEDVNPACAGNFVSITVVGVDMIEWIGVENGYTGDGKNNSNILDHDPNNSEASAVRIFPENKEIGKTIKPKTKVNLKVTLSTIPPADHPLYLRTFDIDDPESDITFIDPNDGGTDGADGNYAGTPPDKPVINYTKDEDNRGKAIIEGSLATAGTKQGKISGSGVGLIPGSSDTYKKNSVITKEVTLDFWVAQFCGDNYRVGVSNDPEFIKNTRNRDKFDGQKIMHSCLSPASSESCEEIDISLRSPVLTVWRTLHIEYDLMKNPDWNDNLGVVGTFSLFESPTSNLSDAIALGGIRPGPTSAPYFINSDLPLKDLSKLPGRFERGGVRILKSKIDLINPVPASGLAVSEPYLVSNGDDNVKFNQTVDVTLGGTLEGILKKDLKPDLVFVIKEIQKISSTPPIFSVELKYPQTNLFEYQNSNLSIGGGDFTIGNPVDIIDNSNFEILATTAGFSNLIIPIEVRDDDAIPKDGFSSLIDRASLLEAQSTFKPVYIDVVNDGGGNITNNQDNLPFTRNLPQNVVDDIYAGPRITDDYEDEDIFKSSLYLNDSYWCCHIIGSWQKLTNKDSDPETKDDPGIRATTYGTTSDCTLSTGGSNCFVFSEAVRESEGINCASIFITIPHELGHSFGLTHGDGPGETGTGVINPCLMVSSLSDMGIMTGGNLRNCLTSKFFIPYHQNLIRIRTKSLGK